jgi:FAD-dependent oxidoreductase domain-containing protein 1
LPYLLEETALKKAYDIVIIGGGIIGTSISYNLMHDGFNGSILVIEKDPTYQFASTTLSAGGVREQFSLPENIKISQYSIDIFETFDDVMEVEKIMRRKKAWAQKCICSPLMKSKN